MLNEFILAAFGLDDIIAFLFWAAVAAALSYTINALTTKVPEPKQPEPNAFTDPDVKEGKVYCIPFGTIYIEDPCVAWYGDLKIQPLVTHTTVNTGFNNKRVYSTVGSSYYLGIHFILCQGVIDGIKQIKVAETVIWPVANDITSLNVDGETSISINEPSIFGGMYSGGGIVGDISFCYGESDQLQNAYLVSKLGADVSAYRGVTSVILEKVNTGNSPYLQPWKFLVKRTNVLTDGSAQWYIAKAVINTYDLNPAHILRECYTNTDWGFGISSGLFLDATWQAVADVLYDEGFGLSMKWDSETMTLYDFVKEVLRHINGKIYQDPATGYIVLKLLRDDYVEGDLAVYDEDDIVSVNDYITGTIYEGVNCLEMKFWDRLYNEVIQIPDHDIASINMQNNKKIFPTNPTNYYGVMSKTLAGKIIARERMQIGSFPSLAVLKTKRSMSALRPGDVFKWSYAPRGIVEKIMRVHEIKFGTLKNGALTIKCVEDIYSIQTALFAEVPDTSWDVPDTSPSAPVESVLFESPYVLLREHLEDSYLDVLIATTKGLSVLCSTFAANSPDFELDFRPHSAIGFEEKGTNFYTFSFQLDEDITAINAVPLQVRVKNWTGPKRSMKWLDGTYLEMTYTEFNSNHIGKPILINNEIFVCTGINVEYFWSTGILLLGLYRGCYDTVPKSHSTDDYVWCPSLVTTLIDDEEITSGNKPGVKIYPNSPTGTLESTDIIESDNFNSRLIRPYPPDDIKINGVSFASTFIGQPTITWYHRDRTAKETVQYTGYHGVSSPEVGTTYTLQIYDQDNNLVRTVTGISGLTYAYAWEDEMADCGLNSGDPLNTQLRFVLNSVRDGYDSWQSIDITVQRV